MVLIFFCFEIDVSSFDVGENLRLVIVVVQNEGRIEKKDFENVNIFNIGVSIQETRDGY